MNAEQESTIEVIDGWVIDTATGEVISGPTPTGFAVNSPETLDWVMGKMLDTEAAIAAIDTTEAVIHARTIIANAEKMKKPLHVRLEWLHARFDTEIGEYAQPLIEGQKTKTHRTLYGAVSFRTTKGGIRVQDEAAAVQWAKRNAPHAVRTTEKFLISELGDPARRLIQDAIAHLADVESCEQLTLAPNEPEPYDIRKAFAVIPDEEKVSVKTGLTQ